MKIKYLKNLTFLFLTTLLLSTCNKKPVILVSNAYVIYPNPCVGQTTISFLDLNQTTKLNVLNNEGKIIFHKEFNSSQTSQFNVDLGAEKGSYYFEIEIGNQKFRDRVISIGK